MRRALVLALVTAAPFAAAAHGDVPYTLDILFADSGSGKQPHIVTTYGMAYRSEGRWLMACEESVSPGPKEWSMTPDGRVVMGHATGVSTSTDFCSYPSSQNVPSSVRWLERAPTSDGQVDFWALLDVFQPGRNLYVSTDEALTWTRVPVPDHLLPNAIRADQSTPGRIVLTAQNPADKSHHLLETFDGGATWSDQLLDFGIGVPRIVHVGPSGIFVRRLQIDSAQLMRSTDGGETFENVLELGTVPGFVSELSDGVMWTANGPGRAWRSEDGGATWTLRDDVGDLMCVRQDGQTLYACVVDRVNNVAVKTSTDAGTTWTPFLRYDEIAAFLTCGAETEGANCDDYWLLSALGLGIELGGGKAEPDGNPSTGCDCSSTGAGVVLLLGLASLRTRRRSR